MKFFNLILLFACLLSFVFADAENYEITYYGCPDECETQEGPACDEHMELGKHDYFAALSTEYEFEQYCKKYVVVMLTNGKPKMIKAKIVDSCGDCSKYHVDLSESAFTALTKKSDGVANIVWGVFSSDGKHLAGPYENKAKQAAEKFKMSKDSFIDAFIENGKKLAASSSHERNFDASSSSHKTTTTTKTITTTTTTTTVTATDVNATTAIPEQTTSVVVETPKTTPEQPQNEVIKEAINEGEGNTDEEKTDYTAGIIGGIGGTLTATGIGLLFLKKKNPSKYEDLKQKFPETFTTVKRGISRGATQLKRKMTKKTPKQPTLPTNNQYVYTAPANLITF